MSEEEAFKTRYANFYNYYNSEGKNDCSGSSGGGPIPPCTPERKKGVTPDGKSPCCEDLMAKKKPDCSVGGCPTGFKPCTMKMTPPYDCDPAGIWKATVLPCPAKPRKKVSTFYTPGPCTRPCCKHWKPKDPPCKYDDVCKAHCYDHPVGIKPSGRYP